MMPRLETRTNHLNLIVAIGRNREIGRRGDMPWQRELPADLAHFRALTMGYPIIMGRRTFESFPNGALPGRRNIIVSRKAEYHPTGTEVYPSLEAALESVREEEQAFIIGGGQLFQQALPLVERLYITIVEADFPDSDTYFPEINHEQWTCTERIEHPADGRNKYPYTFTIWHNKNRYDAE